jgi:hypothetical protein
MIALGLATLGGSRFRLISVVLLVCASLLQPNALLAEQVSVRQMEGLTHGFLALRDLQGTLLADGELTQIAKADRVTGHVIFRFKDGSIYEDTTVFSQRGSFRLLNDHLVQKGGSFKRSMETWLDASTGEVKVRYTDDDGKEKTINQRFNLPPDVGNGLLMTLVKHIEPRAPQTTVSFVATTPKPRLVNLVIVPQEEAPLSHGTIKLKAIHYVVKVKIGGVAGVLAPLVGKQPPDTHVWVLGGDAPAFVKLEGQLYDGGPIWRVELAVPGKFP